MTAGKASGVNDHEKCERAEGSQGGVREGTRNTVKENDT